MTDCVMSLVRTWARLEGFLDLVLLHLCAKADSRAIYTGAGLILSRTREEVSFTNAQIRAQTSANDVGHVSIIKWSHIGLVLTWPWHVKVLVGAATDLDSHVELGVDLGLFELAIQLVGGGGGRVEARRLRILSCAGSNLDVLLSVSRVDRVIALRPDRLSLLPAPHILRSLDPALIGVRDDAESRQVRPVLRIVRPRPWHSALILILCDREAPSQD